mmetsp:Transcript_41932/g.104683  ORF Transcript_41932/g.104683 Transcript_41932/m.104683 type:complete len:81 (-) Transcript_41932:157-399(-)
MGMSASDALDLLSCVHEDRIPEKLTLEYSHQEGGQQLSVLTVKQRLKKVKTFHIKGASETEIRQVLVNGCRGDVNRLILG